MVQKLYIRKLPRIIFAILIRRCLTFNRGLHFLYLETFFFIFLWELTRPKEGLKLVSVVIMTRKNGSTTIGFKNALHDLDRKFGEICERLKWRLSQNNLQNILVKGNYYVNFQNYQNQMLLFSSDTRRTLIHLVLFTKSAQRELDSICTQQIIRNRN